MRFMVIVKGNEEYEAGQTPSAKALEEMTKFNEELVKAGVMLAGEGLVRSAEGARVVFSGDAEPQVVDGPFAEAKELVGGFWILQCRNLEECVEWVKRVPNTEGQEYHIEIRRVAEAEDFEHLTPEVAAMEDRIRAQTSGKMSGN
jgi:hypothetical protein